jgi:hypothetical protein
MSLRLTKIEEGINDGEVLYHAFVEKSVKELAMLRKQALTSRYFQLLTNIYILCTLIENKTTV